MKKYIVLIILMFYTFITFSCKHEKEVNDFFLNNINNTNEGKNNKIIAFKIKFPDTIFVNQSVDGIIEYKSFLDTITTTFGQEEKYRYTRFILTTTDNIDYDFKRLKQIAKDTFGAINNRTIPFYDIKFKRSGIYYIDGLINDVVVIDLHTKDSEGNDLFRLIENEERVTHKVTVVERPISKKKKM